ncbi:unnamed protein product [Rhodiola kirilowii]
MAIQAQMYPYCSGFGMADWGGGGAVGLHDEMCLNLQRQQQFEGHIPPPTQLQLQNQNAGVKNVTDASSFSVTQSLGSLVQKQSIEIDHFIRSQSERLRLILRGQRRREVAELLKKLDARTSLLLKQKDVEIARASNRTSQLESLIIRLQKENETWQHIATQNELHVLNINNTIRQLQENMKAAVVEDAESCCDENGSPAENLNMMKMVCRMCGSREVGVVFLPCRHLCSCTVCEPIINFCPVCQTEKKATVQALL